MEKSLAVQAFSTFLSHRSTTELSLDPKSFLDPLWIGEEKCFVFVQTLSCDSLVVRWEVLIWNCPFSTVEKTVVNKASPVSISAWFSTHNFHLRYAKVFPKQLH